MKGVVPTVSSMLPDAQEYVNITFIFDLSVKLAQFLGWNGSIKHVLR